MQILEKDITKDELFKIADVVFDNEMVKGVVDVRRDLVAIDAELHADLEQLLLEDGSSQEDLWGVNFWKDADSVEDFVEFDSMINVRPRQNNRSRYVEDEKIRSGIIKVVDKWIK
ncbi:hypothetical protein IJG29_01930 [Candidatus Saccharibacteria bacterium]|nr:hypothetical protein [Candidatus Saccharibacteria bacterium]MBQ3445467.1 hypothetical protein [Candidatus Saccharibacteria bacterium]